MLFLADMPIEPTIAVDNLSEMIMSRLLLLGAPRSTGTERELVRVATFNINNINKRLDNLLAWLPDSSALGQDVGFIASTDEAVWMNLCGGLAIRLPQSEHWRLGSATDAIPLPEAKPRAVCEQLVVPSIRSRQIACAEWSNVRRFEHFL